jgi:hypothetical protein
VQQGFTEALEKGTMRGYDAVVQLHIGPTIGTMKLGQLSTPMLERWRDRLLAGTAERAPLSRRLARKVLGTLKSILSEAQRRGLVAQNAALPVKVDAKRREQKKLEVGIDIPGKEDIQKLLAAVTGRHRPLLVAAIYRHAVVRIAGLPWSAVDSEKQTITVR